MAEDAFAINFDATVVAVILVAPAPLERTLHPFAQHSTQLILDPPVLLPLSLEVGSELKSGSDPLQQVGLNGAGARIGLEPRPMLEVSPITALGERRDGKSVEVDRSPL